MEGEGPARLALPSEERSMNIIRVIFVMALELTVIYTRETDRVPMTASDLSRPSLSVDRALGPPSPPPAPPDSAPEAKENQNPQKQKVVACSSSSLPATLAPSFVTYLASPFAEIAPGGEGLCPPARARLRPSGIFNLTLVCLRSPFDVLSGDFAIKSCFSVRLHPTGVRA